MCNGPNFCGPCHNDAVKNWSDGNTHVVPKFGDYAQRATAIERRTNAITQLVSQGNVTALAAFPEWQDEMQCRRLPVLPTSMNAVLGEGPRMSRKNAVGKTTRRSRHRHWLAERAWRRNSTVRTAGLISELRQGVRHHALST